MIAVRVNAKNGRPFIQAELVRANKKSVIVKCLAKRRLPRSAWRRFWRRVRMFFLGESRQHNYIKRNIARDLLPLAKKPQVST